MSGIEIIDPAREAQEGFYISQMTEHDLLEVVEIEEACGLSRWGWNAYYNELTQQRNSVMLTARFDNGKEFLPVERVKGFIAARIVADELHINNVAVREDYRRLGIARKLLERAIDEAARMGARAAFLEVRAGNLPAQALYASCGFRVRGRRPAYYAHPTEDALVMSREIQPSA
jgi:ribosomal-protein-alanine N-acetyltransferase